MENQSQPKKPSRLPLIALGVVLVIVLAAFGATYLSSTSTISSQSSTISSQNSQIAKDNAAINSDKSTIASDANTISSLQAQISSDQSQITTLQQQNSTNQAKISNLETQVTQDQATISSLQSQISTLQSKISTLQSQVSMLEGIVGLSDSTTLNSSQTLPITAGSFATSTVPAPLYAGYLKLSFTATQDTTIAYAILSGTCTNFAGACPTAVGQDYGTSGSNLILPVTAGSSFSLFFFDNSATSPDSVTFTLVYVF